ncbi:DNA-processing protein DprA [Candidatus Saccharibacteria bacterium]|nr:DNA-processing protein DprA [Candidatus Saccharibacteria bacterium]
MSTLFSHFFQKINQISPLEADFTEVLDTIALKPKTLYFYGKMPENVVKNGKKERPKTVAIVGSRHNTRYGEEIAYKLAYELGKRGVIVVSGLAYGIDSIGHRGCLDAGGTTVAILGTRIDDIYPKTHIPLAKEIIEKNGAIISEYSPSDKVITTYSFLERNRLISGLSDIVVVIEAAERSGTLNTAAHALNQGKTVFAAPGNITSPLSKGCNNLIKQGALPYTEPDDVLRELFPEEYAKTRKKPLKISQIHGDSLEETAILRALAAGLTNGSEIAEKMSLTPEIFNQTITLLEIKGKVRSLGANHWALI